MAMGTDYAAQDCSLARALEIVGERWTLLVVRDSLFGVRRFSDFQHHLGMSKAVLSQRLSALVDHGLLSRERVGGREEYRPTEILVDLWPALHALTVWGERAVPAQDGPRRVFRHEPCGGELDDHGSCPQCGTVPAAGRVVTSPGPGVTATPRPNTVSRALRAPRRLLEPIR